MTLSMAVQNMILMGLPGAIDALVVHWRFRVTPSETAIRLGLWVGKGRPYLYALVAAIPVVLFSCWVASSTSKFHGSTIAPFVDASPTLAIVLSAFTYGVLGTGFPEEFLFRGLIAGALFRRTSFWVANGLQALIFLLPHILILLIAPTLWPMLFFVFGMALVSGWVRRLSGSIGPSIVIHAAGNVAGALSALHWGR